MREESSANLSAWFEKRPRWLRIAAAELWSGKALDEAFVQQLEGYCLQEAEGKLAEHVPTFPDDPEGSTNQQGELRLGALADLLLGLDGRHVDELLELLAQLLGEGNADVVLDLGASFGSRFCKSFRSSVHGTPF